jgi:iron-sulfur cluster assembly protein
MPHQISSEDTAMNTPIVTLTAAAAEQAKKLMGRAEDGVIGLRVGIKTAGCSGLQYQVEYATEQKPFEDRILDKGVVILIDPAAVMFLIGSEMDWTEDKFSSSFTFSNPNETARCGCGESFTVS